MERDLQAAENPLDFYPAKIRSIENSSNQQLKDILRKILPANPPLDHQENDSTTCSLCNHPLNPATPSSKPGFSTTGSADLYPHSDRDGGKGTVEISNKSVKVDVELV
jgi:hypothetical protein